MWGGGVLGVEGKRERWVGKIQVAIFRKSYSKTVDFAVDSRTWKESGLSLATHWVS